MGEIRDGEMKISAIGQLAKEGFGLIGEKHPHVCLDEHIVMPKHVHLIINIQEGRGEVSSPEIFVNGKKGGEIPPLWKLTLGKIIAYYKYQTTKEINKILNTLGAPFWQRNYYEHIIRDDEDLYNIRRYIHENPVMWEKDEENPVNKGDSRCPRLS
jgi:REP element-mobilizing transposase RayT